MTVIVAVCPFSEVQSKIPRKGEMRGFKNGKCTTLFIYFKEETVRMSVQVENLEKNMAKLTIEVPAEELEKAIEAAY